MTCEQPSGLASLGDWTHACQITEVWLAENGTTPWS